jgi:hypothetical protein
MEFENPEQPEDLIVVSQVEIARVLSVLFSDFKEATQEEPDESQLNSLPAFVEWFVCNEFLFDDDEIADRARSSPELVGRIKGTLLGPNAVPRFIGVWTRVVLSGRKPPRHVVKSVLAVVLVNYEDGTLVPLLARVPGLGDPEDDWSDASLVDVTLKAAETITKGLFDHGVDGLYDFGAGATIDMRLWEAFEQAIARLIQSPLLPVEARDAFASYLALASLILDPDPSLPPEMLKELAEAELARSARHLREAKTRRS